MLSPAAPAQASPRGALPCPSPSHGSFRLPRCGSRRLGEGRGAHAAFGAKAPAALPARSRAAVGAPTRGACLRPCGGIVARASRRRSHAAGSREPHAQSAQSSLGAVALLVSHDSFRSLPAAPDSPLGYRFLRSPGANTAKKNHFLPVVPFRPRSPRAGTSGLRAARLPSGPFLTVLQPLSPLLGAAFPAASLPCPSPSHGADRPPLCAGRAWAKDAGPMRRLNRQPGP